jgi:hypothetical protein
MGLTARQLEGHRRRARAELEQDYQRKARETVKLLRSRLKHARGQRAQQMRKARGICRAARKSVSARARQVRELHRRAADAEITLLREEQKSACSAAAARARRKAEQSIKRAGAALDAEQRYQAEIARHARKPRHSRADSLRAARERAHESDDQVAHNLPSELQAVWRARAKLTKPTDRATRTEVFLQWAHDHPADVQRLMVADIDRQVAQWVKEERSHARRDKHSRAALLEQVPF